MEYFLPSFPILNLSRGSLDNLIIKSDSSTEELEGEIYFTHSFL